MQSSRGSQFFIAGTRLPDKNSLEEESFILVYGSRGSVHGQLSQLL